MKKSAVLAGCLAFVLLFAGGCAGGGKKAETEAGDPGGVLSQEDQTALRPVDIRQNAILQRYASDFSGQDPRCKVDYEKVPFDKKEERVQRLLLEFAAGEGPDILCLDGGTMQTLWKKGVLADLTEFLTDEARENIWPLYLKAGETDGKLAGVGIYGQGMCCIAADAVWSGNSWTVEDVLNLLEQNMEREGFCGFDAMEGSLSPESILYRYFLKDLEHSPYLDLERGVSHFDGPEFLRTLQVLNRLGTRNNTNASRVEEIVNRVKDGSYFTQQVYILNFVDFSSYMACMGEEAHFVSFPSESGDTSYFMVTALLAVNASSPRQEEIRDFLCHFFDDASQRQQTEGHISESALREFIVTDYLGEKKAAYDQGNGNYIQLPCKKDGSTYLEEYLAWMRSCQPVLEQYDDVRNIAAEEAEGYFCGDRSAEEAAEKVHNRVQLYLDER